jgi:hypothetical protein
LPTFSLPSGRPTPREIRKWRREELQKLTASLLQLSAGRQGELEEAYDAYESHYQRFIEKHEGSPKTNYVAQMGLVVEQIRLLDDQVAEKAKAVRDAHQSAEWEYQTSEESDPMSEIEMLAAENLSELHSALIDTFRVTTDLQKKPIEALNGPTTKKAIR